MKKIKTVKLSENFWILTIPLAIIYSILLDPNQPFESFWAFLWACLLSIITISLIYFSLRVEIIEEAHKKT